MIRMTPVIAASLRAAKNAIGIATTEEVSRRLDVCGACPKRIVGESRNKDRCGVCNCRLSIKASVAAEKCPLNYW